MRITKVLVFVLFSVFLSFSTFSQSLKRKVYNETKEIVYLIESAGLGMPHIYIINSGVFFVQDTIINIRLNYEEVSKQKMSKRRLKKESLKYTLSFLEDVKAKVIEDKRVLDEAKKENGN